MWQRARLTRARTPPNARHRRKWRLTSESYLMRTTAWSGSLARRRRRRLHGRETLCQERPPSKRDMDFSQTGPFKPLVEHLAPDLATLLIDAWPGTDACLEFGHDIWQRVSCLSTLLPTVCDDVEFTRRDPTIASQQPWICSMPVWSNALFTQRVFGLPTRV